MGIQSIWKGKFTYVNARIQCMHLRVTFAMIYDSIAMLCYCKSIRDFLCFVFYNFELIQ